MKASTRQTLLFFWKQLRQFKAMFGLMVVCLIVGVLADLLWILIFREFFDLLVQDLDKTLIASGLVSLLVGLIIVQVFQTAGWQGAFFLNIQVQTKIMANITSHCFEALHQHSYRFFSDSFTGSLVKKVHRLVRGFEQVFDRLYWDMAPLFLKLLFILGVMTWLSPILGLVVLVWAVIFIAANYWISQVKLPYDYQRSQVDSEVTGALADSLSNAHTVKMFAGLTFEMKKFLKTINKWFRKTTKASLISAYFELAQAIFMVVLEITILYIAIQLWVVDKISIADFFVIQAYMFELFHQLWGFGRNLRDLYESFGDSAEMIEILNSPLEIQDVPNAPKLIVKSGKIEFQKVDFAYQDDNEIVFKKLSFKIKPSEKVALIGTSGGGKSTIIKLLLRLFELQNGAILIDNQNIATVTQDSLRNQIALVPQDPLLFHRTLLENIRYGRRNASKQEIIHTAKLANAHEFIMKFPKQYNTLVGERGVKLSGGQRQRIAIARAILSNAKIVILDEATSSLDSESEAKIQDALHNLMKEKTTIVIAHRLSTIMTADRILVLEQGKIIEQGSHSELLKSPNGIYQKLWNLQSGGYLN